MLPTVSLAIALQCAALVAGAKLLQGGTIIAFDQKAEKLRIVRDGSLLIDKGRILDVYDTTSPSGIPRGTQIINCTNKIITPGFVDTHRHGWQTVFKTLGSNTTLAEYASRYSALVAQPLFKPEDVYISQLTGIYEAMAAGVTTILDHAHHTWTPEHAKAGLDASVDSGARIFFAYTFQNSSAEFGVPEQIEQWEKLAANMTSDLAELVISYDDWTANPDGLNTKAVIDLINTSGIQVMTTHHVEGPWMLGGTPQDLNRAGILDSKVPIVIAHAAGIDPSGATLLRKYNKHISITPESEMHYGHLHPTSHLILDQASLGIDTHFTFSTDILTQARLYLQSTRYRIFANTIDRWQIPAQSPFSVNQAFLLATRNGGVAIGRKDIGVIAKDAKADIVIWDGDSPALLGWSDPVAAIILHASVGDIESVLVDGEFKKRDKKLTIKNYKETQAKFLTSARRIQKILRETPLPAQEGAFLTGAPYGYVLQLDAQRGDGTGY